MWDERDAGLVYLVSLVCLVDSRVRASNEGSPRPRVARAQKIIRLHPLLCSAIKKGTWPLHVISWLLGPLPQTASRLTQLLRRLGQC